MSTLVVKCFNSPELRKGEQEDKYKRGMFEGKE